MKLKQILIATLAFVAGKLFGTYVFGALRFLVFLLRYPWLKKKRKFLGAQAAFQFCADYGIGRYYVSILVKLKGKVDYKTFCGYAYDRMKGITAFTHRIQFLKFGWPYFVPMENYRFEDYVKEHILETGTKDEAEEMISKIQSVPMDPKTMDRPMFQFHMIQNYNVGETLLVLNAHHGICDGYSLVKFLFCLTDKKEGVDVTYFKKTKLVKKRRGGFLSSLSNIVKLFRGLVVMLGAPKDPVEMKLGHSGGLPSKNHRCGISFSEPSQIKLSEIKGLSKKFKVSFNDAIYSVITGGLRKYMKHHAVEYDLKMLEEKKSLLKTIMLVNMRKKSLYDLISESSVEKNVPMNDDEMDVDMAGVISLYPVHVADHKERMLYCNHMFRKMLNSAVPYLAKHMMNIFGYLPGIMQNWIFKTLIHKTSCSTSNVPGPQHTRTIAGVEIDGIGFFVGPQGTYSEMISVFSFDSKVMLTLTSVFDQGDTNLLMKFILESLDEHLKL